MKLTPVIASQWNSILIEYHHITNKLLMNSWKCYKLQARLSNLNVLGAVQLYLLRNMTEHTVCALTTVNLTSWQRRMSYIPATLDRWRVRHLGWGSVFFWPRCGRQVLADANERRGWAYTVRLPSQLIRDIYDCHLISSVGRAPVCRAGNRRFKPPAGPSQCCRCNDICKSLYFLVFSDKEEKL